MTKICYCKCVMLLIAVAIALSLVGCGGGGGTSATPSISTGVEAVGSMLSSRGRGATLPGFELGNPAYKDGFLAPTAMSISAAKLELLRGEDDPNPYVVFDRGSDFSLAKTIDLMDGASASFGENSEYPEAGTYTHIRLTLVYLQETVAFDLDGAGVSPINIKMYASSVAPVVHGDVLMQINGTFCWQKGGQFYPVTGARPDVGDSEHGRLVQFEPWAGADSPDPYLATLAFPAGQEMVVPENPSGKFVVRVNFDGTTSPQAPGASGVFFFDDIDEDGVFEPGAPAAQGGDGAAPDSQFGEGKWDSLQPTVTASFTQVD